ncbi:MAG TPA: FkbM family methyltransferase [Candidatus Methylomirabilis sp.]|nr:FkbM family methyltransferase [Candidatus Methylomirabilis sp.]
MRLNVDDLQVTARRLFLGSRVYSPLRSGYQFLFDRARYDHRLKMRSFYGAFIRKGDVVFDVGAHVGRYSEVFADLGGSVVAVEPNTRCCEQLRHLAAIKDVHVENCAAGDEPGKLKLQVCENSFLSTVAPAYYEEAKRTDIHKHERWLEPVDVDVVTLDQLAQRYGVPSFVKIDAEGYDDHVLLGMSFRPEALIFEYAHILPEVARRCFATPILSTGYEFNFSRGLNLKLASEKWLRASEILDRLPEFVADEVYGDVIARSTSEPGA